MPQRRNFIALSRTWAVASWQSVERREVQGVSREALLSGAAPRQPGGVGQGVAEEPWRRCYFQALHPSSMRLRSKKAKLRGPVLTLLAVAALV